MKSPRFRPNASAPCQLPAKVVKPLQTPAPYPPDKQRSAFIERLFSKSSVAAAEALPNEVGGVRLLRALGNWDMVAIGLGAIIGGGLFTMLGPATLRAGPAVLISFVLGAFAALFAALAYAELGAMVPTAGSAYTYAYATMGQLVAWIIGWDLLLEYDISAAPMGQQFSASLQQGLTYFGIHLPYWAQKATYVTHGPWWAFNVSGSQYDIIAFSFSVLISICLAIGIRESAFSNNLFVILKIAALVVFVVAGAFLFDWHNFVPFSPYGWGKIEFGMNGLGVIPAAALLFFIFSGFDMVTCAAEEAKNPQRSVPFGVIGSLVIGTLIYSLCAFVLVGATPAGKVQELNALGAAIAPLHNPFVNWALIFGVMLGTGSCMLVQFLGQIRILYVMARDGMLPPWMALIHPRFRTPALTTIVNGLVIGFIALIVPIDALLEIVNLGIFSAFIIVMAGVIWLRWKHPELERPFRSPFVPWFPAIGIIISLFLSTVGLGKWTWLRFLVWFLVGIGLYFAYGYRHARSDRGLL